ncbi:carboxylic acid transporter, partial [Moniliophthora roreri MCA 2997]
MQGVRIRPDSDEMSVTLCNIRLSPVSLLLVPGLKWSRSTFIPLWITSTSLPSLATGAFFVQFDVLPILLSEISPRAFRASFAGCINSAQCLPVQGPKSKQ